MVDANYIYRELDEFELAQNKMVEVMNTFFTNQSIHLPEATMLAFNRAMVMQTEVRDQIVKARRAFKNQEILEGVK